MVVAAVAIGMPAVAADDEQPSSSSAVPCESFFALGWEKGSFLQAFADGSAVYLGTMENGGTAFEIATPIQAAEDSYHTVWGYTDCAAREVARIIECALGSKNVADLAECLIE